MLDNRILNQTQVHLRSMNFSEILPDIFWPSFSNYVVWTKFQIIWPMARASTIFTGEHENFSAVFAKSLIRFVFLAIKNFSIFTCRKNVYFLGNSVTRQFGKSKMSLSKLPRIICREWSSSSHYKLIMHHHTCVHWPIPLPGSGSQSSPYWVCDRGCNHWNRHDSPITRSI